MGDLVKAARLFANIGHGRITAHRNPALQSSEVHLKSVAQIVSSVRKDDDAIAAAWLHDLVEDTGVTIDDVERMFGEKVAKIVGELTVRGHPPAGRHGTRIALVKEHFANVSESAKTVKLADLIDTCRDFYKNDPTLLTAYAKDAHELTQVLNGGDPHLLARLKRDLSRYASAPLLAESVAEAARSRAYAFPIGVLRVVERALTARHVAEPLIAFDSNRESREVVEAMTVAGVEVAGLHREGILWGFVEAESLREGSSETNGREFAPSQVVNSRSSLAEVIEVLTRHDRCFVSVLGNVVGVISRSDLHKPAVRMWLFGIITAAELEFTERIRRKWLNESWISLLSAQRLERAKQLSAERARRKEECHLLDCLQLSDKIEILKSDPSELAALGISTSSAARNAGKQIESLRNSLAHAQSFVHKDWPQVVRLARRIQQLVEGS